MDSRPAFLYHVAVSESKRSSAYGGSQPSRKGKTSQPVQADVHGCCPSGHCTSIALPCQAWPVILTVNERIPTMKSVLFQPIPRIFPLSSALSAALCTTLLLSACGGSDPEPPQGTQTEAETPSSAVQQPPAAPPPTDIAYQVPQQDMLLDEGWQFFRFPATEYFDPVNIPEQDWQDVELPHTTRIEPRVVNDQWQGDALYRRTLFAPEAWGDKTIWIRFEGAMMVAHVYLNGDLLHHHQGGYLPFTVDISKQLRLGTDNELLVHLDNRDNPLTGPKPLETLDFTMYGGLYRDVVLSVRDTLHISDEMLAGQVAGGGLFVRYENVSQQSATVKVQTHVENRGVLPRRFNLTQALLDHNGDEVSRSESPPIDLGGGEDVAHLGSLFVANPRLWSPRSPSLYTLMTRLTDDQGLLLEEQQINIGIRHIRIDQDGLYINEERYFLRGVNRHQEYPYVGYALSPNADYRDAKLIKEAGFDYVRLSHYPHSKHFMAAADELGLVVLDAILGWQYFNPDPAFSDHVVQTCRDMIRRDRNHPSVLAWECSLNESEMPETLVQSLHNVVHEEYPGGQAYSAGWLPETYDIYLQARQHRERNTEITSDKPYIVSEYGDWEYFARYEQVANPEAGLNQAEEVHWKEIRIDPELTSRQALANGEALLLQQFRNIREAHSDNLRNTPAIADGYWVMFDYNRGYSDDLETSGLMSIERLPKPSWYFFRSQRKADEVSALFNSGAMVHIANEWRQDSPREVVVFSNAEEVQLYLNGNSLGRQTPDDDPVSQHLHHPPFTFQTEQWEEGELLAVAYRAGAEVARHQIRSPGEPQRIETEIATQGVVPVRADLLFAYGRIVDAQGTTVPLSGTEVRFMAADGLRIIGPDTVPSENGIASILVKVTDPQRSLQVSADFLP